MANGGNSLPCHCRAAPRVRIFSLLLWDRVSLTACPSGKHLSPRDHLLWEALPGSFTRNGTFFLGPPLIFPQTCERLSFSTQCVLGVGVGRDFRGDIYILRVGHQLQQRLFPSELNFISTANLFLKEQEIKQMGFGT